MPLTNEYEVIRFFNDAIDVWGMDVFHLNDITNGHPLVTTACAIFRVSSPNAYLLHVHPITKVVYIIMYIKILLGFSLL